MKVIKKIIVGVLALSLSMVPCFAESTVNAFSDDAENTKGIVKWLDPPGVITHIDKTMNDIISSYDDAFIFNYSDNRTAVISKEGKLDIFTECQPYTLVTMKNGEQPPVEEINRQIGSEEKYKVVFYNKLFTDEYKCYVAGKEYQNTVYSILKDDENVNSIEECRDVTWDNGYIRFILINSEENTDELIAEYPDLKLKEMSQYPEYMYEIYPEYNRILGVGNLENPDYYKELYSVFTSLEEKGMPYLPTLDILASEDNSIYASSKNLIYCAEEDTVNNIPGDINLDGKVDVTDLTELSLALLGDTELTSAQQKAADVDGNGDIKLADLATLKQYLSKQIESLG